MLECESFERLALYKVKAIVAGQDVGWISKITYSSCKQFIEGFDCDDLEENAVAMCPVELNYILSAGFENMNFETKFVENKFEPNLTIWLHLRSLIQQYFMLRNAHGEEVDADKALRLLAVQFEIAEANINDPKNVAKLMKKWGIANMNVQSNFSGKVN